DADETEELAERAQNDDAARLDIRREALGAGTDIHEGLVDDQQTALAAQVSGQPQQVVAGANMPVRVVRVDDDGEVGVEQGIEVPHLRNRMSDNGSRSRMFGIGWRQHRRPAPPREAQDRKSTRLNSSHVKISYAVF